MAIVTFNNNDNNSHSIVVDNCHILMSVRVYMDNLIQQTWVNYRINIIIIIIIVITFQFSFKDISIKINDQFWLNWMQKRTNTRKLFPYCSNIWTQTKFGWAAPKKTQIATKLSKKREVKGQICSRVNHWTDIKSKYLQTQTCICWRFWCKRAMKQTHNIFITY